jgi:hypothetical protein
MEKRKNIPDIPPYVGKMNKILRPIHQYGLDGKYIKTFDSQKEATEELGITGGGLWKCLTGKSKTCKNHMWRYAITD